MMRTSSGIVCAVAGAMLFAVACSWGGASDPGHVDAGANQSARCGDGVCAATEIGSCPADCGMGSSSGSGSGSSTANPVCGNNTCEAGETAQTCPGDCTGGGSGSGALDCTDLTVAIACGVCLNNASLCFGVTQTDCNACVSGLGGGDPFGTCNGGAPDGVCDSGEDPQCFDCLM